MVKKGQKRAALAAFALTIATLCAGCAELPWKTMEQKGRGLLEQGAELNEQLADKAKEVNEKFWGESALTEQFQKESQSDEE